MTRKYLKRKSLKIKCSKRKSLKRKYRNKTRQKKTTKKQEGGKDEQDDGEEGGHPLPHGWERATDAQGNTFFFASRQPKYWQYKVPTKPVVVGEPVAVGVPPTASLHAYAPPKRKLRWWNMHQSITEDHQKLKDMIRDADLSINF